MVKAEPKFMESFEKKEERRYLVSFGEAGRSRVTELWCGFGVLRVAREPCGAVWFFLEDALLALGIPGGAASGFPEGLTRSLMVERTGQDLWGGGGWSGYRAVFAGGRTSKRMDFTDLPGLFYLTYLAGDTRGRVFRSWLRDAAVPDLYGVRACPDFVTVTDIMDEVGRQAGLLYGARMPAGCSSERRYAEMFPALCGWITEYSPRILPPEAGWTMDTTLVWDFRKYLRRNGISQGGPGLYVVRFLKNTGIPYRRGNGMHVLFAVGKKGKEGI